MPEKEIDVVVAGHVCLDIAPVFREGENIDISQIFSPGKLTNTHGANVAAAGVVSNVGITLDILGMNTRLMGKTGKDLFGKAIIKFFEQKNMKGNMLEVDGEDTSYTIVIAPPGIDRMFLHSPGTNDTYTANDIDYDVVGKARLFHFGYPPLMQKMYKDEGKELVNIFKKVNELGVITSLDMAFTEPSSDSGMADWVGILKRTLPFIDIYMPSLEETLYMLVPNYFNSLNENLQKGCGLIDNLDVNILQVLGDKLISFGAKVVVVKCGTKGYYVRTGSKESLKKIKENCAIDIDNWSGRELLIETYDVDNIKSTTGSGDSSIAGFIAALLKGKSIEDTTKIAHAVATQSIQSYDVFSNIKSFSEINGLITTGMPKISIEMNGDYWKYDSETDAWRGQKDKLINKNQQV